MEYLRAVQKYGQTIFGQGRTITAIDYEVSQPPGLPPPRRICRGTDASDTVRIGTVATKLILTCDPEVILYQIGAFCFRSLDYFAGGIVGLSVEWSDT